jgi:hypothetical protein
LIKRFAPITESSFGQAWGEAAVRRHWTGGQIDGGDFGPMDNALRTAGSKNARW